MIDNNEEILYQDDFDYLSIFIEENTIECCNYNYICRICNDDSNAIYNKEFSYSDIKKHFILNHIKQYNSSEYSSKISFEDAILINKKYDNKNIKSFMNQNELDMYDDFGIEEDLFIEAFGNKKIKRMSYNQELKLLKNIEDFVKGKQVTKDKVNYFKKRVRNSRLHHTKK